MIRGKQAVQIAIAAEPASRRPAALLEMSLGGLGLYADRQFALGTQIRIGSDRFCFAGEVRYCRKRWSGNGALEHCYRIGVRLASPLNERELAYFTATAWEPVPTPSPRRENAALDALSKLPAFHPVALRVMNLSFDEDCAIVGIVRALHTDPALSSVFLAVANTLASGSREPFQDLRRAIVLMGLEQAKSLITAIILRSLGGSNADAPAMVRAWRHSISCALLAEHAAPQLDMDANRAYTAALLHDVGRIGLLAAFPGKYSPLLEANHSDVRTLLEAERRILGVDHCEAGAFLTRRWRLPKEVQEVTEGHHDQPQGKPRTLTALTRLVCHTATRWGYGTVSLHELPAQDQITVGPRPSDWAALASPPAHFRQSMSQYLALLDFAANSLSHRQASVALEAVRP